MWHCNCGFGDDPANILYATVHQGHLTCPHCAGQIVCEIPPPNLPKFLSSADVYSRLKHLQNRKTESFHIACLDARNRMTSKCRICIGSLTECPVHPREVFFPAVHRHAAAVILVHNHPSGDPQPSPDDFEITKRLVEAGVVLGIPVLDHVIIGKDSWYSFRDAGRL